MYRARVIAAGTCRFGLAFYIVFCRYVLIYLSTQLKKEVLQKISEILNPPKGVLFLGNSEVFTDYEDSFVRMEHQGGVYYMVKESGV